VSRRMVFLLLERAVSPRENPGNNGGLRLFYS
jgi:hypothetical protein